VEVLVDEQDNTLRVSTRDDGIGGADPRRGSGLTGLRDRVEALGGLIEVISATDNGTTIKLSLPIHQQVGDSGA
jgi:signal transduction histidine kinase